MLVYVLAGGTGTHPGCELQLRVGVAENLFSRLRAGQDVVVTPRRSLVLHADLKCLIA